MNADSLHELDNAVRYLRERGAIREGGTWTVENIPLGSDPITAARRLRAHLISRGPANSRQQSGHPIWTR
jgi:hypothetical protein